MGVVVGGGLLADVGCWWVTVDAGGLTGDVVLQGMLVARRGCWWCDGETEDVGVMIEADAAVTVRHSWGDRG